MTFGADTDIMGKTVLRRLAIPPAETALGGDDGKLLAERNMNRWEKYE